MFARPARVVLFAALLLLVLGLALGGSSVSASASLEQPALGSRHSDLLEVEGLSFRDLNKSGVLEAYEDWRRSVDERVQDLLGRMTLAEKVAQMLHPTFIPKADGSAPPFLKDWAQTKALGFLLVRDIPSGLAAANLMNQIQEWSEQSRLGIPAVISMDSVHGLSYVDGGIVYPHNLGLAATGDIELISRLAEASRAEHLAIGVRMTLSPNADLATEPRWGRVMECPGEDSVFASLMVEAIVTAYQNGISLNRESVLTCVKHFPGAGPEFDGVDMAPIVSTTETLPYHLAPFQAAISAGAGSVMPYYSIPLALDTVAALGSKATLEDLLRDQMGFEGIINTDWGMEWGIQQSAGFFGEEISEDDALVIGLTAGVDVIGGASTRSVADVPRLVEEGRIPAERIDEAVRRVLRAKFEMGIFENPYVDPAVAERVVGSPEHQALSLEAAERSMTLLKNEGALPLSRGARVLLAGARAGDIDSLAGGWTSKQTGLSLADALALEVSDGQIVYVGEDLDRAAQEAARCDVAVVAIGEPSYMHNPPWGADTLDLTPIQQQMLETLDAAGIKIVTVVLLGRPYILTWCAENAEAILVAYYPGTQGGQAIANTLFGDAEPSGKLPLQLPRSMEQVKAQKSDVAFDIDDPLYDYGAGMAGWGG